MLFSPISPSIDPNGNDIRDTASTTPAITTMVKTLAIYDDDGDDAVRVSTYDDDGGKENWECNRRCSTSTKYDFIINPKYRWVGSISVILGLDFACVAVLSAAGW